MTPTRRRLAIAVAPRLLGEALSRVLGGQHCDVTVFLPGSADVDAQGHAATERFDIAVLSHDAGDVQASVVIRLPETPTVGTARVGGKRVRIRDLDGLVALVERCAATLDVEVAAADSGT